MKQSQYLMPSKEDIVEYYINNSHTKKECAEYFKTTTVVFTRWLSKLDIRKLNTPLKKKEMWINETELKKYYIDENHTQDDCARYFNTSIYDIKRHIQTYGLIKTEENVSQTIKKRNQELYGSDYYTSSETIEKRKQTCLEKYGFDNPSKNPDIIKKIKDSMVFKKPTYEEFYDYFINKNHNRSETAKHFGVSESLITKWAKEFQIEKNQKQILSARQNTCLKKYGKKSYLQTKEYRLNLLNKYGVDNKNQINIKNLDIYTDKEKFKQFLLSFDHTPKATELIEYFNVVHSTILHKIHEYGLEKYVDLMPLSSQYEDEIVKFLKDNDIKNIELHNRTILGNKEEIDIYLPEYKFGIEFNGEYWHCDIQKKYQDYRGRSIRHQEKSLLAESKGVFLFHIFEHEWSPEFTSRNIKFKDSCEKIKSRILTILGKNTRRIGARKCEVVSLSKEEKTVFLNENHLQGNDNHSSYCYGLKYENEIVACMCFGKSKYKKYNWELTRFCSLKNTHVIGGASKLFNFFIDNMLKNGETIVSYSDITKTKGDLYQTLGFDFVSVSDPNYWWVNLDNYDVRSRYQEQAAGEVERMHSQNYHRICDSGVKTWVYTKKI